jgi:hypothetical protein
MFVEESSSVVKKVLEKYADNMMYVFLKFDIRRSYPCYQLHELNTKTIIFAYTSLPR